MSFLVNDQYSPIEISFSRNRNFGQVNRNFGRNFKKEFPRKIGILATYFFVHTYFGITTFRPAGKQKYLQSRYLNYYKKVIKVKILHYFIIFTEICMVLFHTGRQATYSLVSNRQASKCRPKADNAASLAKICQNWPIFSPILLLNDSFY